jgi:hypothetical protein
MTARTKNSIDTIKAWLFPGMVSLLGMLILQEVNSVKSDVKQLLAASTAATTNVSNNDKRITRLEDAVFVKQQTANLRSAPTLYYSTVQYNFPKPLDMYFKHEEEMDVKKYLQ